MLKKFFSPVGKADPSTGVFQQPVRTMKRWIRRPCFALWIAGLSVFFVPGFSTDRIVDAQAKELPIPATIQELLSQPELYDGHRVFVSGRVRRLKLEIGRRGSEYMDMVLEEVIPETVRSVSLQVFSMTLPQVGMGNQVSVQGTYHRHGRFGGWPHDDFIEAEAIIRDK